MSATIGGIYVRISQDRSGSGLGVDRQEQDCRALAERLGWTIRRVYVDNDVSAYSGKRRPQYEELLHDIESGAINGVLTWHPDRLHRSPKELERYIDLSEAHRVETHSVQAGRWDLSTPAGRAVARTLGAWARYESEHKGARVRRARQQQALAGEFHGGIRPYGFERDGVTIRPAEADEIRKAAESIVAGVSLRSLVRDLNERGIPTATGRGGWTSNALREIVMRPRTAGLSSHRGEIVAKAVWPAIVPEDVWRAACTVLSDPARRTNQRGAPVRWLGSGIYLCGVCGQPTLRVGVSGRRSRNTYRCNKRDTTIGGAHVAREAEPLDEFVEAVLVERLSDPKILRSLIPKTPDVDTAALVLEQAAIRERQDELAALFSEGSITARQLATGTEKLTVRADEITAELAAGASRGPLSDLVDAEDLHRVWYGAEPDRSDSLALGKRRAILSSLLSVTVLPKPRDAQRPRSGIDPEYLRIEWKS